MSIDYLNIAFKAEIKPSSLKFVLVALADYANEAGEAYPSIETLERKTSQNRKTILSNIAKLAQLGILSDTGERKGRTKQIPVYMLNKKAISDKQYQKRNSTKSGTVPFLDESSTKNGTLKQSQKRDTEPSVLFNHQEPSYSSKTGKSATPDGFALCVDESFNELWNEMPLRKTDKARARKSWQRLCKGKATDEIRKAKAGILKKMLQQAEHVAGYDSPFWEIMPSTYLNNRRWEDESMPSRRKRSTSQRHTYSSNSAQKGNHDVVERI